MSAAWAADKVNATLKSLEGVRWHWKSSINAGLMETKENVWSRSARRKKRFVKEVNTTGSDEDDDDQISLAVTVTCKHEAVEIRWLRGMDHVIFESFCGMLKRALTARDQS